DYSVVKFEVGVGSRFAQLASLTFDASVLEIFSSLTSGATLCLFSRELVSSPIDLAEALRRRGVTAMVLPPSLLDRIPSDDLPSIERVIVGGEACAAETAARWSQGRSFWNAYAPTEATIYATALKCDEGARVAPPLGKPVSGMRVYN